MQDCHRLFLVLGMRHRCLHIACSQMVSSSVAAVLIREKISPLTVQAEEYEEVFGTQMLLCNDHLNSMPHIRTDLSGSTAITAILEGNGLLTVANVGDSRCILGQLRNQQLRVTGLSTDHNPEVPEEAERILSKNVSSGMRLYHKIINTISSICWVCLKLCPPRILGASD